MRRENGSEADGLSGRGDFAKSVRINEETRAKRAERPSAPCVCEGVEGATVPAI